MEFFTTFKIAGSGLSAQRKKMDVDYQQYRQCIHNQHAGRRSL